MSELVELKNIASKLTNEQLRCELYWAMGGNSPGSEPDLRRIADVLNHIIDRLPEVKDDNN